MSASMLMATVYDGEPMKKDEAQKVEYIVPPESDLMALAYAVCQKLADTNPDYLRPDIRGGFAKFLTVLIRLQVQGLNRQSNPSLSKIS